MGFGQLGPQYMAVVSSVVACRAYFEEAMYDSSLDLSTTWLISRRRSTLQPPVRYHTIPLFEPERIHPFISARDSDLFDDVVHDEL
jgi:hypothetical protein